MLRENFFFIHQGETNRLAMATPVERIKMLEKFAGADEWEKDKEKVAQDLDECTKSLEEFDIKLEELDGDLDNLSKGNKIHNIVDEMKHLGELLKKAPSSLKICMK